MIRFEDSIIEDLARDSLQVAGGIRLAWFTREEAVLILAPLRYKSMIHGMDIVFVNSIVIDVESQRPRFRVPHISSVGGV
jgi:hypothetical protein